MKDRSGKYVHYGDVTSWQQKDESLSDILGNAGEDVARESRKRTIREQLTATLSYFDQLLQENKDRVQSLLKHPELSGFRESFERVKYSVDSNTPGDIKDVGIVQWVIENIGRQLTDENEILDKSHLFRDQYEALFRDTRRT